jgi:hypothetical protein
MGDFESEPLAGDSGGGGAAGADEAPDPVKAAEADAWLAQFRADNVAKMMEHNYEAAQEAYADAEGERAKSTYLQDRAKDLAGGADWLRDEAAALEDKAEKDAARRDEYEAAADVDRQKAEAAETLAGKLTADATAADKAAGRLEAEGDDLFEVQKRNERDLQLLQEQAVAAQRIAANEARLQHPGEAAPGDASGASPETGPAGPAGDSEQP